MSGIKQQVIDETVKMVERLNSEISEAIDKEITKREEAADHLVTGHIRMRLSAETKRVRKYIRITRDSSVVAFVCTESGDVFKPASWQGPAKHARGNVFSDNGGREAFTGVDCHGLVHVKYLK